MLNRVSTAAAVAIAAILFSTPGSIAQEPIKLTFSAFSTSGSPNHRLTVDKMIAEIEKTSNGKVKFETYFGGSAYGNAPRQFEQVQRGLVDIAHGLPGYTPGRFPLMEVVELPFLFDDHVAASGALWATYEKHLAQEFPDVKPLAIWLTSMQQMHFRQPVAKLDDLRGQKIRAGGPIMADALRKLGAEGIIVPAPAIYERMQKGVLDGAIGAWGMLAAFKLGEVASHHLDVRITAAPLFIFMNKKKYDSLPDDVKKLFDAYANEKTAGEFATAFGRSDVVGKKIGASEGHTTVVLSPDERQRWAKTVQPVVDGYLEDLEKRGLKAKAFHKDFLAEYEKRAGKTN